MSNKPVIAGTILSYISLAVQSVATIVITPFIIINLGDEAFGVYKIATSLIGYLGILNFGFGNAAIKYLTEIKMHGTLDKEKEFLSMIKLLNLAAVILSLVAGLVIYNLIPTIFAQSFSSSEISLARQLFIILIFSMAVNIVNDIYVAILNVHERFVFLKGLDLFKNVLRVVLILAILTFSDSAVVLTIIDLLLSIIVFVCSVAFCDRKLQTRPKYSFRVLKTIHWPYYKEVIIYSSYYFLNLIVSQLIWNTDSIIIGMRRSSFDAAVYGAGANISNAFYSLSLVVGVLMFPRVVRLVSSGASKEQLTNTMIKLGRMQAFLAFFIVTVYFACGKQFVSLWLGDRYMEAWTTSLLVMIGSLFPSITVTGQLILRAINKQKFYLLSYLVIFLINAVITYLVVVKYGIVGGAFVTLISFIIGVVFMIMPHYKKTIGINTKLFFIKMLPQIVISAAVGIAFYFIYTRIQINTWGSLILSVIVYAAVYYSLIYFTLTTKDEKLALKRQIEKWSHKLKPN